MRCVPETGFKQNWGAFVRLRSNPSCCTPRQDSRPGGSRRNICHWCMMTTNWSKPSIVAAVAEQSELRRIARGLGEAEMAEGMRGQQPPARGALQVAALDQERLH